MTILFSNDFKNKNQDTPNKQKRVSFLRFATQQQKKIRKSNKKYVCLQIYNSFFLRRSLDLASIINIGQY